jgi:hypothetical protein
MASVMGCMPEASRALTLRGHRSGHRLTASTTSSVRIAGGGAGVRCPDGGGPDPARNRQSPTVSDQTTTGGPVPVPTRVPDP